MAPHSLTIPSTGLAMASGCAAIGRTSARRERIRHFSLAHIHRVPAQKSPDEAILDPGRANPCRQAHQPRDGMLRQNELQPDKCARRQFHAPSAAIR
jgi:hypothetical protein